jgi:hypothetical protein
MYLKEGLPLLLFNVEKMDSRTVNLFKEKELPVWNDEIIRVKEKIALSKARREYPVLPILLLKSGTTDQSIISIKSRRYLNSECSFM